MNEIFQILTFYVAFQASSEKILSHPKYIPNFSTETFHISYLDTSLVKRLRTLLILIWEFKKVVCRMEASNGAYSLLQRKSLITHQNKTERSLISTTKSLPAALKIIGRRHS